MTQDNPEQLADQLIEAHGLDGAIQMAMQSTAAAADNYALSVWREVKQILYKRRDLQKSA